MPLRDVSFDACARVCKEAPHCSSFTFENGRCVLQGSFVPSDTVYCTKRLWGSDATEASFRL